MWHEARKQEKKIRGIMVDLKKRAERRKEYFDRIKRDPAEFLQVWGTASKSYIDATSSFSEQALNTWSADPSIQIDRFDIRAHLDTSDLIFSNTSYKPNDEELNEERMCNYERYRLLVQNDVTGTSEKQCLQQINLDEKFGCIAQQQCTTDFVEKKSENKAAIYYSYGSDFSNKTNDAKPVIEDLDTENLDLDEMDLDLLVNVNHLTNEHKHQFNVSALKYGMYMGDYVRMLTFDQEEIDALNQHKIIEAEKAQFSGRKARRERRIAKERRVRHNDRRSPSFIPRLSPKYESSKR
ncbi:hypothetical protein GJ496_012067, partial [Pomphorhynchus laevis]